MSHNFKINDVVSFNEESIISYKYTTSDCNCIAVITAINEEERTFSVKILDIIDEYKHVKNNIYNVFIKHAIYKCTYEEYLNEIQRTKKDNCNLNNLLLNGF